VLGEVAPSPRRSRDCHACDTGSKDRNDKLKTATKLTNLAAHGVRILVEGSEQAMRLHELALDTLELGLQLGHEPIR